MAIPHWRTLCDDQVIKHRPLLNSLIRAGVTAEDVYPRFMDALPKIFCSSSIPKVLRVIPRDQRDKRWVFLNPHTAVVKLKPGFPIDSLMLKVTLSYFQLFLKVKSK